MKTRTELHRHLDVAMPIATLHELAQSAGLIGESTSLKSFQEKVVIRRPLSDLNDVLSRFTLYQKVLYCRGAIERMSESAALQCAAEGLTHVELRYSPSFVSAFSSVTWEDALSAIESGIQKAKLKVPHLHTGLICIASREYGPDAVAETVDFYLKHAHRFVGVDLAGNEAENPCHLFEDAFRPVKQAKQTNPEKIHVTIHAGEASGPENVWEALDLLGAERIGHGVRSLEDPLLIQHLISKQIPLENCPTSNILTRAARSYDSHPIKTFLDLGVPVTLSTDDPSIFGVTYQHEIDCITKYLGLRQADLDHLEATAQSVSFIPHDSNK